MMRRSLWAFNFAALALALAFAAQGARAAQASGDLTVVGRLTPTVEAGGWLVVSDYGGYLLLNAAEFRREPWFREGATVEATGRVREDVMSIHMQGVPFQAKTLRARGGGGPARGAGGGQQAAPGASPQQQVTQSRSVTRVVVTGDAVVQAENASRTEAVLRAVRAAAGAGAEVGTSGYSLQPQFAYKEGAPPTITGYVVRNAVTVTTGELTRVGRLIDAASAAGANSVDGLAFTLRRDEQARQRALGEATREAVAKARALAQTLGGRFLRVVEVQEGGAVRPVPYSFEAGATGRASMAAQSAPTPIESGPLEIRAHVQLVAEIETRE
jgi:hypothetical protein